MIDALSLFALLLFLLFWGWVFTTWLTEEVLSRFLDWVNKRLG